MSYAFSPITSKQQFEEALAYIVREAARLSKSLTGASLQLRNAKVFAHYPEEYRFLEQLIFGIWHTGEHRPINQHVC